jgi:hypothetical protein
VRLPPRTRRNDWLRPLTVATALALGAIVAWFVASATPSTEAVRVRNSFLAVKGTPADFDWRPPAAPAGFLQQSGAAPAEFSAAAARVPPGSAFERAIGLAAALDSGPEHGGPIQSRTVATYRAITTRGGGYCADYTQVLNGLAWAAGLPVREWGVSFDGFGGFGHAFNEIYDPALGKWVMIDPFYGFYLRDMESGTPLSAIEFRDRLRGSRPLGSMMVIRFAPRAYDFTSDEKMLDFYRRGVDQFYLWWGNNVFDYDDSPLVKLAAPVSRAAEQLAAMVSGVQPGIRILPTEGNAGMVAALMKTRDTVLVMAGAGAVLAVVLLVELMALAAGRRGEAA